MAPDEVTEAADLKVIETAAALRKVLLDEQAARDAERDAEKAAQDEQHRREKRWIIMGAAVVFVFGVLMSGLLVVAHFQRQDLIAGFERSRQDGIEANIVTIHCVRATTDFPAFERCVRSRLPAPP